MKLSVLTLLALGLGCFALRASAIEVESSVRANEHADSLMKLPINNPCARECASDAECPAQCSAVCKPDDMDCQLTCRAACLEKATSCVAECAREFTEITSQHDGQLPTSTMRNRQPRHHSLNTGFGPETAKNWAGYVSVNGSTPTLKRHLWYWAFESRNDPANDPLVLWMTGGPGCSGLVALFKENGPYIIADDLSLSLNPYSWNSNATVIWIDQPSGSGYSYSDAGDVGPFDEAGVADNVYQFLQGFLMQYPQFQTVPFYITGESYAGHYIPSVATRILAGNEVGGEPIIINLDAIAIGNGLVNPAVQYSQYLPFIAVQNVLPNSSLSIMAAGLPACEAAIASCGFNSTTGLEGCLTAMGTCNLFELMPFQLSGLNVYDVREKCAVPPLCYNFTNVDLFLAQPAVISALGTTGITWQSCNKIVELELVFAGDWMRDLSLEIPAILASKVRVIVYSGEYDFVCNWYGGLAWTNALVWPGQSAFVSAQNTTWISTDGQIGGSARTFDGFTFLRVKDAGHMVPLNQPQRALDLLSRVISGEPFDSSLQAKDTLSTVTEIATAPRVALE